MIPVKELAKLYNFANEHAVKTASDEIQSYERTAKQYEAEAESYHNLVKEYQGYAEKAKEKLAEAKKVAETSVKDHEGRAKRTAQHLEKHKGVASVTCKGGIVTITTPLLFCAIRTEAGSKEHERTCIGAYACSFDLQQGRIKVRNLLFSRHWAINTDDTPCLGEFANEVRRTIQKKDIYALFDTIYQLLLSADMDGGAYMRSHDWKANYRTFACTIEMGEFVVAVANGDMSLKGRVGVVTRVRGGSFEVAFKAVQGVFSELLWNTQPHLLAPITQKQFKAANIYTVGATPSLARVDAMKSTSLEEAKALLAKHQKVTLSPYETANH